MGRTSLRWDYPSSLVRPGIVLPPPGPLLVQSAYTDSGSGTVASLTPTLPGGATAGNLLIAVAGSDATISTPSGFAPAASVIAAQAAYIWYKVAAGGETSAVLTPSVTDTICGGILEYSGMNASPFDQIASASNSVPTTGPVSAGSTPATTQASELVIAVTNLANFSAASVPTAPSHTGGFTTELAGATTFATASQNQALFVADLIVTSTGAQSTSASWTNIAGAWGALIATFKAA